MEIRKIAGATPHGVGLNNIDDSPGPCCMSFGFDLKPLILSIDTIGLINSPVLIESGQGKMTIIAGFRRVQAFKYLKRDEIPCRILLENSVSHLECILINLHDNLSTRKLNDVEKGMVLSRLSLYLPESEILEHYMPLLDLPSRRETLFLFMALESEPDVFVKESVVRGSLSLKTFKRLLKMDHESRTHVLNLLSSLKFNSNQQTQLFEYLIDLKHIHDKSLSELLGDISIKRILSDENLNMPQKAKAVLGFFRSKRFPTLADAESTFRKKVSRLGLPKGVKIVQSRFFEAPYHRLEIRFREGEDLKKKIEQLTRSDRLETLRDPWEEGG